MTHSTVVLKPAKEYPIRAGHPWIFSNAIESEPKAEAGDLILVQTHAGLPLGIGMINPQNSIRVRMICPACRQAGATSETPIDADYIGRELRKLDEQKKVHLPPKTTGYRVCHADADGLPGLIVDRYSEVFVFQIHTAGMEKLKDKVIEAIKKEFKPSAIVERSDVEARKQEGLKVLEPHLHHGKLKGPVEFMEYGIPFYVDVMKGQKTGFFLDQRDTRIKVGQLSKNRKVLNLFGYTGAFSVHAAIGSAAEVATVDVSGEALEMAKQNLKLNGFDPDDSSQFQFMEADVMALFRNKAFKDGHYDLIICDPPAFAKSADSVRSALEAYSALAKRCLWMLKEGGILVTSSCSGRVTMDDFKNTLRLAAGHTGRDAKILATFGQAFDHTEKLSFPEGKYLKTVILEVTRAVQAREG